jgi:hypothetical protein
VYLARANTPYSEAYADLDLPASPYELLDALDKLRLDEGEAPYLQINDYYDFEELAPLLSGDAGLYEAQRPGAEAHQSWTSSSKYP